VESTLKITAAQPETGLLELPWRLPLEEWPEEILAALPRGISRHVVRFVKLGGRVLAVKETRGHFAFREYDLLRTLGKLDIPCVQPVAVVSGRTTDDGEELGSCIVTEHLPFSLPYRAVFSQALREETGHRLIDALAVLLVRLHLAGFYWGDVSLSNTLFRRDADRFAAYLVDAETGELQEKLTPGQRDYDVDLARTNIIGELFDLEAGDYLDEDFNAIGVGDDLVKRYNELWSALTDVESYPTSEPWRITEHIRHLNELGFDVAEFNMITDAEGSSVKVEPKVVDAGHHSRRLLRLTGMDVQDNQARRMLNSMDSWWVQMDPKPESEQIAAHDWLINVYEPAIAQVPKELRGKLDSAQIFHELLDHRWYISEKRGESVPIVEAAKDYVETQLRKKRDEQAVLQKLPGDTEILYLNQSELENESTEELAAMEAVAAEDAAILQLLKDDQSADVTPVADRPDPLAVAAEVAALQGDGTAPSSPSAAASSNETAGESTGETETADADHPKATCKCTSTATHPPTKELPVVRVTPERTSVKDRQIP